MITLSVDLNRLQRKSATLQMHMDQTPGMAAAAIRDTIREWRELAVDSVTAEFAIDRSEIDQRIGSTQPTRPDKWLVEAAVFLKSKPIRLRKFGPRQVAKGVAVRVHRNRGAQVIRGAFGPDISRLGGGVYRRTSRKRTPIKRQPGVRLPAEPVARMALQRTERQVAAILYKHLDRRIRELAYATRRGQTIYEFMSWEYGKQTTGPKLDFDFRGVNYTQGGFSASVDAALNDSGFILSTEGSKKNLAKYRF